MRQQVQRGNERVRQGVEILVADGGQILQPDAAVFGLRILFAAVDGDSCPRAARRVESSSAKVSKPP